MEWNASQKSELLITNIKAKVLLLSVRAVRVGFLNEEGRLN